MAPRLNSKNNCIQIKNLNFTREDRVIFENLNLNIEKHKITSFFGPSGCGKTTLLKLITGLEKADSGSIDFNGLEVINANNKTIEKVRKQIGFLFQNGALLRELNVYDNVAFPLRIHTKLPEHIIRNITLLKLQAVGLRGAKNLMPHELSGGMLRRVALARAIVLDPEMVLYDEPFAGQDPSTMKVLLFLIKNLNEILNITSILVSHDIEEALEISDNVVILASKDKVITGTSEEIKNSKDSFIQDFIKGEIKDKTKFQHKAMDIQEELNIATAL